MKRIIAAFISVCLLLPQYAMAAHIQGGLVNINTNKTITIAGVIDDMMLSSVIIQMRTTSSLKGPRLVLIRSPGGNVETGKEIIQLLEQERARTHQPLVCVVIDAAHSMAFDLLTHCDLRLATSGSTMVVHKVAISDLGGARGTAKNLREAADEMDKIDGPLNAENAKAMHLSLEEYNKWADKEREWTARELLRMHYLSAIVEVTD